MFSRILCLLLLLSFSFLDAAPVSQAQRRMLNRFEFTFSPFHRGDFLNNYFDMKQNLYFRYNWSETLSLEFSLHRLEGRKNSDLRAGFFEMDPAQKTDFFDMVPGGLSLYQEERDRTDLQYAVSLNYFPFETPAYFGLSAGRFGGGSESRRSLLHRDADGQLYSSPMADRTLEYGTYLFLSPAMGFRWQLENGGVFGMEYGQRFFQKPDDRVFLQSALLTREPASPESILFQQSLQQELRSGGKPVAKPYLLLQFGFSL